jgi:hypothetical protein
MGEEELQAGRQQHAGAKRQNGNDDGWNNFHWTGYLKENREYIRTLRLATFPCARESGNPLKNSLSAFAGTMSSNVGGGEHQPFQPDADDGMSAQLERAADRFQGLAIARQCVSASRKASATAGSARSSSRALAASSAPVSPIALTRPSGASKEMQAAPSVQMKVEGIDGDLTQISRVVPLVDFDLEHNGD